MGEKGIKFKLINEADIPLLHEWLNRPHVAEWWDGPISLADVRRKYKPRLDGLSVKCYIAYLEDRAIGFIQSYHAMDEGDTWWPEEQDRGVYGIDQFLANPADIGHGLGRQMISDFLDLLFSDAQVTRVQTDPAPNNERAIRCYKAVGFVQKGIVDTPDGPAMLMLIDWSSRNPV